MNPAAAQIRSAAELTRAPPAHAPAAHWPLRPNMSTKAGKSEYRRAGRLPIQTSLPRRASVTNRSLGRHFTASAQRDSRGRYPPMDSLLAQSYEQHIDDYIQEGRRLEDREEHLEAKYHSLVAHGKFREAMELMRKSSMEATEAARRLPIEGLSNYGKNAWPKWNPHLSGQNRNGSQKIAVHYNGPGGLAASWPLPGSFASVSAAPRRGI